MKEGEKGMKEGKKGRRKEGREKGRKLAVISPGTWNMTHIGDTLLVPSILYITSVSPQESSSPTHPLPFRPSPSATSLETGGGEETRGLSRGSWGNERALDLES